MRKVLAVFMAVMMILSTFTGMMTVLAADVTTTLVEIPLGDLNTSTKKGTLTATDYVKSEYSFAPASNGNWETNVVNGTSSEAKTIKDTYARPNYKFSVVNASDLSTYTGIAAGHSAKLLKFTQTANHFMFRLMDFYDVSKLPTTGTLRLSVDVYPADIVPGTTEDTTATSVKSGTATLSENYRMRIGDSTGSSDGSNMTGKSVTANQWNTISHEIKLSDRATMDSIRIDLNTGINKLTSYTTAFPATIFYDKVKIEYIGEAISGGDNTGGDNTGSGDTDQPAQGDKTKVNIGFEDGTEAPAGNINIWGKTETTNLNEMQTVVNWADETGISKPNSTEDFGSKVLKVDGVAKGSIKGVHTGRIDAIPADVAGITAGKKYTYSFWILAAATSTSTNTAKVNFTPYCNNASNIPDSATNWDSSTFTLTKGEWTKVTGSFVATAEHANMTTGYRINFFADSTNYATIVYMDNFNIVESDGADASYDLAVTASGNGKVTGAGTYKGGEKATLTATADEGYIFAGWYNDTTLLSKENPYEYTVDGSVTAITGKFEKFVPNTGDNWVTLDGVDFEEATAEGTSCTGKTASGIDYKFNALDGGKTDVKVSASVVSESEEGIGSTSNKVYKFQKTEGNDENTGVMRFFNLFSVKELSVGDIVRVSFKVYPTDLCIPEGATDKTAGFVAFYSVSNKYGSGSAAKTSDSTGIRYIKKDQWNEVGFTTTITQEMLDAASTASLRLGAAGTSAYAKTMYFDDFKAELYQDRPAADMLNIVENFESDYPIANFKTGTANAPYAAKKFTTQETDGSTKTYIRYNIFGTGATDSVVSIAANAADLSGVVAHSGTNAVKWAGRYSANAGVKIEDIFMGRFDKDDIGRKIKVSAWVYADKSAGAYKLKWNETKGEYAENTEKANAPKYEGAELEALTKTVISISLGGPNDDYYKYRSGNYNTRKTEIKWNEWTKISTEFVITESLLDNGITNEKGMNTLISSIRIDQQKATGLADQAIIDTFYIDDITVEDIKFNVSDAIGTHMVYQKGRPIRVWGTNADIGEVVTVKFNGTTKTATTATDKNWVVEFDGINEYKRNLEIEISCPGEEKVTYTDISVGEVILASGQSNMEWTLNKVYEAEDIIADAETNENISILSFEPSQANRGSYEVLASPKGAYWSKKDKATAEICSGIGYITAYNIAKKYDIPVAVVDANLSGSSIKAWLSADTIEARKDDVYKNIYKEMVDKSTTVSSGSIWKSVPAGMYNSFIAPLDNYEIGIMLWYQGCSNSGDPMLYNYQQYDLINSWRAHFGTEETPFYICQLAPYQGQYMGLRQVQLDTAKRMDNVHLIVTADLGPTGSENADSKLNSELYEPIHPVRKIPVANRISLNLYANYFGEDILYSGPEYTYIESKEDHAIIHFKHIGSGIVKSDETKDITGFEISADGETYVAATAEILADNTIKVYAENITNPEGVRYCWVNWVVPEGALSTKPKDANDTTFNSVQLGNTLGGNLTNDTGIPVGPFMATLPAPTIFAAETKTVSTGIDISIAVRNKGYSEANPRLIVGLYDGDRLVGLKSETIEFKTIDTKTLDFKFYTLTTQITDNTTIKAFLWNDMGTMIPLTGVYPINRK